MYLKGKPHFYTIISMSSSNKKGKEDWLLSIWREKEEDGSFSDGDKIIILSTMLCSRKMRAIKRYNRGAEIKAISHNSPCFLVLAQNTKNVHQSVSPRLHRFFLTVSTLAR